MINKLKKLPSQFKEVLTVASQEAVALGFKIYLVGGVTRDLILGKTTFDLDVLVEGDATVLAAKIAEHFRKDFRKHHAFGTAVIYFNEHKIDFATARREHYSHWGGLPKVTPAAFKEDLFRRDFTVNAMAIGLNKDDYGELIDFYGGISDLKKGLIRVLHEKSFLEDPTRILRAVRFQQRFSFKMEKDTQRFLNEALKMKALTFVHPHRLSDELILILKEPKPIKYIKRLYKITELSFIDEKIKLNNGDFRLFMRIEKTIALYKRKFSAHKKIDEWLLYLAAIIVNLSREEILEFFRKFGLKKTDMIKIFSVKENLFKIRKLNRKVKPHLIYHLLNSLNQESIIFFYAYYPQRKIRKNIEYFLEKLKDIYLKVKGEDLKSMGLEPLELYSLLLQKLLYVKIDKGFKSKDEEIRQAKLIFQRLIKRKNSA